LSFQFSGISQKKRISIFRICLPRETLLYRFCWISHLRPWERDWNVRTHNNDAHD